MRINKKRLRQRQQVNQIKLPQAIKKRFAKAIANDDVPSNQQIRMAINLGVIKKNVNGHLDVKSLINYFRTFIQQRQADNRRNQ